MRYIYHIDQSPSKRSFGNKALGLKTLLRHRLPVPGTWLIPVEVQRACEKDPGSACGQLRVELEKHTRAEQAYAVRSSGELEDLGNYSFAGQFATILDVKGPDALMDAISKVWDSNKMVWCCL